jgi:hypothetical protein
MVTSSRFVRVLVVVQQLDQLDEHRIAVAAV